MYISVEVCFVGLVFVSVDVEAVCSVPCVVDFVVVVCLMVSRIALWQATVSEFSVFVLF